MVLVRYTSYRVDVLGLLRCSVENRPRFKDETTTTESLLSTTEDDKSVGVVKARAWTPATRCCSLSVNYVFHRAATRGRQRFAAVTDVAAVVQVRSPVFRRRWQWFAVVVVQARASTTSTLLSSSVVDASDPVVVFSSLKRGRRHERFACAALPQLLRCFAVSWHSTFSLLYILSLFLLYFFLFKETHKNLPCEYINLGSYCAA